MAPEVASTKTTESAKAQVPVAPQRRWSSWAVPVIVLVLAAVLLFTIMGRWNRWTGGAAKQTTDDAYLHADLTPLSTKVSAVVAKVNVSDYQHVKAGDLSSN